MADSEISTTLSRPSRRTVLAAAMLASGGALAASDTRHPGADPAGDPALAAWREWHMAFRRATALCRKQQRLETRLQKTVGIPNVLIEAPCLPQGVWVGSLRAFDELATAHPALAHQRDRIAHELGRQKVRWDTVDRMIGYSVALQEESNATDQQERLAQALWSTQAVTPFGVAAKPDAIIRLGETHDDSVEFPWPQLRVLKAELHALSAAPAHVTVSGTGDIASRASVSAPS
ncbi:hypothetical protein FHS55_004685 [Angulomicrobium tetraedrale]|uniref:Uncharacterized protein n=1 Tax=Ancylobacter tetraedralis TaxID=217068 RepID=A0A839ZHM1_9HYPH|nr:hypothetical protein [Ancylobacter tetraedralis]MBB3774035.1 hypothetical protein [Ancylobacter tetraedralis]